MGNERGSTESRLGFSVDKYIGPGGDVEGIHGHCALMCSTHHFASCSEVGGDPGRAGLHSA